ncbi:MULTISPECIES: hypothetical protein [Shouchella]|uniref:Uncharacterized protein n=2 Tax=Shouchella TaxID=2893057 RepID=A0ABY7W149_9BACI|nr:MULTISPECIES: hypothetical protein [Shouchella]MED4128411.1 hypothetical protein [Shouchella miscanthi]WDF02584.1 hypothetical protein PQ477_13795 [Shouchella hunanensis]GAF20812.1 hypothetical protein JCM19047_469 [Bacillus sp. JCM 19047]
MPVLMFCNKCGTPKKLSEYVLSQYVTKAPHIYCDQCDSTNSVTEELRQYAFQVKESDNW